VAKPPLNESRVPRVNVLENKLLPESGRADYAPDNQAELVAQLGHSDEVCSACMSRDGKWLVTGGRLDHTACLWETATGKQVRTFLGHAGFISSVCLSSDGRWLATGSWDKTARLWETATGLHVRTFQALAGVSSVFLSVDGKWLVTGGWDNTAQSHQPSAHQLQLGFEVSSAIDSDATCQSGFEKAPFAASSESENLGWDKPNIRRASRTRQTNGTCDHCSKTGQKPVQNPLKSMQKLGKKCGVTAVFGKPAFSLNSVFVMT
jgi:WD40 repeat protein